MGSHHYLAVGGNDRSLTDIVHESTSQVKTAYLQTKTQSPQMGLTLGKEKVGWESEWPIRSAHKTDSFSF